MNHMVPELTDDFWGVFFPHELRLLVMRRYNNQNVKCLGFTDSSGFLYPVSYACKDISCRCEAAHTQSGLCKSHAEERNVL